MPEPDWKTELQDALWSWCRPEELDALLAVVTPHMEAAYERGLIAGRSQAGYQTRRKKKEKPKWYHLPQQEATDAPSAGTPSPASSTGEM